MFQEACVPGLIIGVRDSFYLALEIGKHRMTPSDNCGQKFYTKELMNFR